MHAGMAHAAQALLAPRLEHAAGAGGRTLTAPAGVEAGAVAL